MKNIEIGKGVHQQVRKKSEHVRKDFFPLRERFHYGLHENKKNKYSTKLKHQISNF